MSLVPAKCPECGGNINIDPDKKAGICEYCKQPFVVQEAIQNFNSTYNITNNNEILADVVNIYESSTSIASLLERAKEFIDTNYYEKAEHYLNQVLDLEPKNEEARSLLQAVNYEKRGYREGEIHTGIIENIGDFFAVIRLPYYKGIVPTNALKASSCQTEIDTDVKVVIVKRRSFNSLDAEYELLPLSNELGTMPTSEEGEITSLIVTEYNYPLIECISEQHPEIREIHIEGPTVWGNNDGSVPNPFTGLDHDIEILEIPDNIQFRSYNDAEPLWNNLMKRVNKLVVSDQMMMNIGMRIANTKHYLRYLELCREKHICPRCKRPLVKKLIKGDICTSRFCPFNNKDPFKSISL